MYSGLSFSNCCDVQTASFVCFALVLPRFPDEMYAQFIDPRNYDNTPVGPFSSGRYSSCDGRHGEACCQKESEVDADFQLHELAANARV